MDIELLRRRIRKGDYLIRAHAIQHALKEGFEHKHMIAVVLTGSIIEEYPDDERVLLGAEVALAEKVKVDLHVVCEYSDPVYAEFVTAYIPVMRESKRGKKRK